MKHTMRSLLCHLLWIIGLILVPFFSVTLHAAPAKIDFEDRPSGSQITKEYWAKYGVEFNSARICKPAKGTASGSLALTHATSLMELSQGPLIIKFKEPQSLVRLAAGLNDAPQKSIKATMQAYDANGKLLKTITKNLGSGPTKIAQALEIQVGKKEIRQVRLTYEKAYFEVIDDLEFDNPATHTDTKPPTVNITKPKDQANLHSPFFELRGTIQEDVGLLNVEAAIKPLNQAPDVIKLSGPDIDDSVSPIEFGVLGLGLLSPGENKITVTATDVGNNKSSDSVTVFYFPQASGLRKLGVYSLWQYENGWKGYVGVGNSVDPYCDFWEFMVNGSGAYSVDKGASERFLNQQVTIKTIIPIPGDNLKSWDDFDMVFFYGHNNTIVPPPDDDFVCYVFKQGAWKKEEPCKYWGSPSMPFDYYASGSIKNAKLFPGAVTYLYHEYTASLLGDPYDYGGGEPEGAPQYYKVRWFDKPQKITYGKLGSQNLKWLILHGCQAVITASSTGDYRPLAYEALSEVHGGYHIILGHYHSYYTTYLEPLEPFGFDLICGVPVQTAYFDTDPITNSSAIAAENTPFSWSTSTMVRDTWLSPVSVPSTTDVFSQRWIAPQTIIKQKP